MNDEMERLHLQNKQLEAENERLKNKWADFDPYDIDLLNDEVKQLKTELRTYRNLLEECGFRCQIMLPENDVQAKWFDEGVDPTQSNFIIRLYKTFDIGI